ncbi:MAG: hypothetical protein AB8G11_24755 [Saprospiraceae bacterium]
MKFLQLNRTVSRIFVVLYLFGTLIWRFLFEAQLLGSVMMSMVIGIFFLFFLWALIKSKILNPEWFWFEDVFKKA